MFWTIIGLNLWFMFYNMHHCYAAAESEPAKWAFHLVFVWLHAIWILVLCLLERQSQR